MRIPMKTLFRSAFFILIVFGTSTASAQSIRLRISEVNLSEFPSITLTVNVTHNGLLLTKFTEANFLVLEDGARQQIESLYCPGDSSIRLSVVILLDRSGSMARTPQNQIDPDSLKIRAAKAAIRTFIGFLTERDETALYSFSSNTTQFPPSIFFAANQNFTTDTAALRNSLVPIFAAGGTWIWQAMIRSLDSLRTRTGKKVLIAMTDGKSQGESISPQTVVNKAVAEKIPIYTIGLGSQSDIDESSLKLISNSTGGQYYRSPDQTGLEQIFMQLANEIITDACQLRYTTTQTCFDGKQRLVEVAVSSGNIYAEDDTNYTPENRLAFQTMRIDPGAAVISKSTTVIPVTIPGSVSLNEEMKYSFKLRYNPTELRFQSVITQATISMNGSIDVTEIQPGLLDVSCPSVLPAFSSGTLLNFEFFVIGVSDSTSSALTLESASFSQNCPTNLTLEGGVVSILPCRRSFEIASPGVHLIPYGGSVLIPLTIAPNPELGAPLRFNTDITFDTSVIKFLSVEKAGTLSESATVNTIVKSGRVNLAITGTVTDTLSTLILLRFMSESIPQVQMTDLVLSNSELFTECRTTFTIVYPTILINGECEQVLGKKVTKQTLRNYPNPFNPRTTLVFTVVSDGHTKLAVHDASGRELGVLLDTQLSAGEYKMTFDGTVLPSGSYFAILTSGASTTIHPIMLLK